MGLGYKRKEEAMNAKPKMQDTKAVIRIIDEEWEAELKQAIESSKVYKDLRKYLPGKDVIAYLYQKDRMRFASSEKGDGLQYVQEMELDSYLKTLHRRANLDLQAVSKILENFNLLMEMLKVDDRAKGVLESLFRNVRENYWQSRTNGLYEMAMEIIRYFSIYLHSEPVEDKMEEFRGLLQAFMDDYKPADPKKEVEKIRVDDPKNLTLVMDYSFDRNKHEASYRLESGGKSIRLRKLFSQTLYDYLIYLVVNPLTADGKNIIKAGSTTLISKDVWDGMREKRPHHIDHINKKLREHVTSDKKLKFFSQRGRNIEVRLNIRIVDMPRKQLFIN